MSCTHLKRHEQLYLYHTQKKGQRRLSGIDNLIDLVYGLLIHLDNFLRYDIYHLLWTKEKIMAIDLSVEHHSFF